MAWEWFNVEKYQVYEVAYHVSAYPNVYAYIGLLWQGKIRATLWFYRDGAPIPKNDSFQSEGVTHYYGRFGQTQFPECVDLLRNEQPVFFGWNADTKGVTLSTGTEPVGEAET